MYIIYLYIKHMNRIEQNEPKWVSLEEQLRIE